MGQIQVGDQIRARGAKSDDGTSMKAEEVVSGSFRNLAGTIVAVDATAGSLTVKDLETKKIYSIKVTPSSNLRALPPEAAARFAARAKGEQSPGQHKWRPRLATALPALATGQLPGRVRPGMDLSQLVNRLPQGSIGDLHAGEALMVVASQETSGSDALTAVTLLSGWNPSSPPLPKARPL